MPTYSYECKKCGEEQDEFHGILAAPLIVCNSCGSKRMNRLLGKGGGIIFKGSGFYETDYKNKGSDKGGKDSAASSESKGDSKAKDAPAASKSEKSDSSSKAGEKSSKTSTSEK